MIYSIIAIPQKEDLKHLNTLREYIYQNGFRFRNKPLTSDTHMTVGEVNIEESRIGELKEELLKNVTTIPFFIDKSSWVLTKADRNSNYKNPNPYVWIALKFPQIKKLYDEIEVITDTLGVNNNQEYIENVRKIDQDAEDCIANHINLSNYTRREKADECWTYFKDNLPTKIVFDTLALRDQEGNHIFEIKY